MRTVGRPAKASALKGQAWVQILDTELLGLLQDGLGVYFDRWQEDLNSKTLTLKVPCALWLPSNYYVDDSQKQ